MNLSVLIATYGHDEWRDLAWARAYPSAQAQADDVVVVHQPDGDVATSRNAAAAQAAGEWLCFLDADDELTPGFISAIQQAHNMASSRSRRDTNRTLFTPSMQQVINGRAMRPRLWRRIPLESGNWMIIATVVHKALFDAVGGFRLWPHGLEDWDLWSRIWKTGCEVQPVKNAVYAAHRNYDSKHHILARNKPEYMYWHQKVGNSNWPDLYDCTTAEEDQARMLLDGGSPRSTLRMLVAAQRGRRTRYVGDGILR